MPWYKLQQRAGRHLSAEPLDARPRQDLRVLGVLREDVRLLGELGLYLMRICGDLVRFPVAPPSHPEIN